MTSPRLFATRPNRSRARASTFFWTSRARRHLEKRRDFAVGSFSRSVVVESEQPLRRARVDPLTLDFSDRAAGAGRRHGDARAGTPGDACRAGDCVEPEMIATKNRRQLSQAYDFRFRFSATSLSAVVSASAAGTFTSGSTPVPSQFVLVIGLIARANGTPMMK